MLTFLRKIRRSLIDSGATRKYLLYAVGEITLVVIGILIALQINNWNEYEKGRIREIKILKELALTIKGNCDLLQEEILDLQKFTVSTDTILSAIQNNLPYNESFDKHFHYVSNNAHLSLTRSGYEELKNVGLDIILNDSLKNAIIDLFENRYPSLNKILDKVGIGNSYFSEYRRHNFMVLGDQRLRPLDYNTLINDHYYETNLMHVSGIRGWHLSLLERSNKASLEVLELINDGLKN